MVNYGNGKIYKIESHLGDKIFIGSTTKEHLCQRMDTQRHNYDAWKNGTQELTTVYLIFEEYGVKNCKIILLEAFPCKTKDELESKKEFYIKSMDCVNKVIPQRTTKEYREDNKEKLSEQHKLYYQNNKETISARKIVSDKLYYENNKVAISAKRKERRLKLKELNK